MSEQWFAHSDSVDDAIRDLFTPLLEELKASRAEGWQDDPETLLAAVIVLDQFSRNIHRGTAEAFAADPLARTLALSALDRGWDARLAVQKRHFLYMPLMHAEDSELQTLCLKCFDQPGLEQGLDFARQHAEVIARFGRFPTRNAAVGRESTAEEQAYLSQPGVGW